MRSAMDKVYFILAAFSMGVLCGANWVLIG
jgi:hypothetical protein